MRADVTEWVLRSGEHTARSARGSGYPHRPVMMKSRNEATRARRASGDGAARAHVRDRRSSLPAGPAGAEWDRDIVVAMRQGDTSAFVAFVERFHRLLCGYAERAFLDRGARDDFVDELLDDIALQIMTERSPLPENPATYIIAAFRHKLLNASRSHDRQVRVIREAVEEMACSYSLDEEAEVAAGCSESMMRTSYGPTWEEPTVSHTLTRLAQLLSEGLSDDERQLLVFVAAHVPQRDIAAWLGMSHASARKRLQRLRVRLTAKAVDVVASLDEHQGRDLRHFLQRCGMQPWLPPPFAAADVERSTEACGTASVQAMTPGSEERDYAE